MFWLLVSSLALDTGDATCWLRCLLITGRETNTTRSEQETERRVLCWFSNELRTYFPPAVDQWLSLDMLAFPFPSLHPSQAHLHCTHIVPYVAPYGHSQSPIKRTQTTKGQSQHREAASPWQLQQLGPRKDVFGGLLFTRVTTPPELSAPGTKGRGRGSSGTSTAAQELCPGMT